MASYPPEAVKKAMEDATKQLGYAALTRHQALAVEAFLSGRDVFVSLPTGSGKSLCYCVLPKAFDLLRRSTCTDTQSVAIVVSPLVSLMVDQVRHMTERHVSAIYAEDCDHKSEAHMCDGVTNWFTDTLEDTFDGLKLRSRRAMMDRTIVLRQIYDQCSYIYKYLVTSSGKEVMEPICVLLALPQCHLVDMFTACTHPTVKKAILETFLKQESVLRVVVVTIAFGMGLDCPNVRRIIHWDPSSNIESYL